MFLSKYFQNPVAQPKDLSNNFLVDFDKQWATAMSEFDKQMAEFKKIEVMPIVTQSDDLVTVTFKGPNVTTTVTASQGKLPEVLKQFGLEMPKLATKPKTVAKKKAKDAK